MSSMTAQRKNNEDAIIKKTVKRGVSYVIVVPNDK